MIIGDLPDAGQHPNPTLAFGPDGMLYISAGSTCNVCNESNPENATLLRATPDGKQRSIFATGLRNGSWQRKAPSGYEIVRVRFADGQAKSIEPFVTGFLTDGGTTHIARPVGLAMARDGALLMADDANGVLYRIAYSGRDADRTALPPPRPLPCSSKGAKAVEAHHAHHTSARRWLATKRTCGARCARRQYSGRPGPAGRPAPPRPSLARALGHWPAKADVSRSLNCRR